MFGRLSTVDRLGSPTKQYCCTFINNNSMCWRQRDTFASTVRNTFEITDLSKSITHLERQPRECTGRGCNHRRHRRRRRCYHPRRVQRTLGVAMAPKERGPCGKVEPRTDEVWAPIPHRFCACLISGKLTRRGGTPCFFADRVFLRRKVLLI